VARHWGVVLCAWILTATGCGGGCNGDSGGGPKPDASDGSCGAGEAGAR
jgi:hypothetical protein